MPLYFYVVVILAVVLAAYFVYLWRGQDERDMIFLVNFLSLPHDAKYYLSYFCRLKALQFTCRDDAKDRLSALAAAIERLSELPFRPRTKWDLFEAEAEFREAVRVLRKFGFAIDPVSRYFFDKNIAGSLRL